MRTSSIKTTLRDFIARTSRLTLTILALLVLLSISALILLLAQPKSKKKVVARPVVETDFRQEDDFFPPERMTLTEDYYFSRVANDTWTREEVDRWFTKPNVAALEDLGRANDALVEEILGAAP